MMTSFKYTGTALPVNAEVVELFSTVTAFPGANYFQMHGIHRMVLTITNSHAGTLKVYQSQSRATGANSVTWVQIVGDDAVSAATNDIPNIKDYVVEPYADWKVTWTSGGNSTKFTINVVGIDERTPSA